MLIQSDLSRELATYDRETRQTFELNKTYQRNINEQTKVDQAAERNNWYKYTYEIPESDKKMRYIGISITELKNKVEIMQSVKQKIDPYIESFSQLSDIAVNASQLLIDDNYIPLNSSDIDNMLTQIQSILNLKNTKGIYAFSGSNGQSPIGDLTQLNSSNVRYEHNMFELTRYYYGDENNKTIKIGEQNIEYTRNANLPAIQNLVGALVRAKNLQFDDKDTKIQIINALNASATKCNLQIKELNYLKVNINQNTNIIQSNLVQLQDIQRSYFQPNVLTISDKTNEIWKQQMTLESIYTNCVKMSQEWLRMLQHLS